MNHVFPDGFVQGGPQRRANPFQGGRADRFAVTGVALGHTREHPHDVPPRQPAKRDQAEIRDQEQPDVIAVGLVRGRPDPLLSHRQPVAQPLGDGTVPGHRRSLQRLSDIAGGLPRYPGRGEAATAQSLPPSGHVRHLDGEIPTARSWPCSTKTPTAPDQPGTSPATSARSPSTPCTGDCLAGPAANSSARSGRVSTPPGQSLQHSCQQPKSLNYLALGEPPSAATGIVCRSVPTDD